MEVISLLKWKSDYSIGIEEIDEQHKMLFNIAEQAYSLFTNNFYNDKYDKILEIIEELRNYTIFHFKCEEEYMLSINYKRFLSQKIEHDEFIEKFNNIDPKLIDQEQDKYIISILEYLVDWLSNHILEKDKLITTN